jgi:hypothetical protein
MKTTFRLFAALGALAICSAGSEAKVFSDPIHNPPDLHRLRNADSFSVECKNNHTGVIDRESVYVETGTVVVEIPDSQPAVHHITSFSINERGAQDKFGQLAVDTYLQLVQWGTMGNSMVGLLWGGDRWTSHHEDGSWWTCAN